MKRIVTTLMITAVLGGPILALPLASAQGSVDIIVQFGPPEMPYYPQPPIPGDGYLWAPGYWGYGDGGYFWVPGTWVLAPAVGLLWTPGWWGWGGGYYAWHQGYWGPNVGYYGGINYGHGYDGHGYAGGYWRHGAFYYNRSVNNMHGKNIHNTYSRADNNDSRTPRISYNGGPHGINARPTSAEQATAQEHHISPTTMQMQHERGASANPAQRASPNHRMPEISATPAKGNYDNHTKGNSAETNNHAKQRAPVQQEPRDNPKPPRNQDQGRPPPTGKAGQMPHEQVASPSQERVHPAKGNSAEINNHAKQRVPVQQEPRDNPKHPPKQGEDRPPPIY
ncbi:MAG TPA: hypothetical protein VNF48_01685 [Gammaproteobacteria bacterium]|nr:hypothetical protein [Gammaproteobacteria bacterium]